MHLKNSSLVLNLDWIQLKLMHIKSNSPFTEDYELCAIVHPPDTEMCLIANRILRAYALAIHFSRACPTLNPDNCYLNSFFSFIFEERNLIVMKPEETDYYRLQKIALKFDAKHRIVSYGVKEDSLGTLKQCGGRQELQLGVFENHP